MSQETPPPPKPTSGPGSKEYAIMAEVGAPMTVVCSALSTLIGMCEPQDMPLVVGSLLANVFGPIRDDVWQQITHAAAVPCGVPHCTCHIRRSQLFEAIDGEREVFRKSHAEAQLLLMQRRKQRPTDG